MRGERCARRDARAAEAVCNKAAAAPPPPPAAPAVAPAMAAAGPASTRLTFVDPWEWPDGVVRNGPPPREWVLRWRTMQRDRALAATALRRAQRALAAAHERSAGATETVAVAHRATSGAWWELFRPSRPGPVGGRPMEARRDEARARAMRAQAALRDAAAGAEAAVTAAREAARELEGALARIADIRDPAGLGATAPVEHAGAAGRPPAHTAAGEAGVGAPEPRSGAGESQEVAREESAEEAQEEAAAEGAEEQAWSAANPMAEDFYAEALGDVISRIRHDLVSNFTMLYCDDAELGAAARRCWGESLGELNPVPRPRRNSRSVPY